MFARSLGTVAIFFSVGAMALTPPAKISPLIHAPHPRIIATRDDFASLKNLVQQNAEAKAWYQKLRDQAKIILSAPPSKYDVPHEKLLFTSRTVLSRVTLLSFLYRLDSDQRYSKRAWDELAAATKFPNWDSQHFLTTAEMVRAFAIGYDWLYDALTESQRTVLREAIVDRGFKPAMAAYTKKSGWTVAHHNWNLVCNGGLGIGALAIATEAPEWADNILERVFKSLPSSLGGFDPDGAWPEGPTYWSYATDYLVAFIAALDSAAGSDFGLSQSPGFLRTGQFPIHITGPTGLIFNYSDAQAIKFPGASQLFWLATKMSQPAYADFQMRFAKQSPGVFDLLWGAPWLIHSPDHKNFELDRYFRNSEIVTLRGAWDDPNASYVAFKAGSNDFGETMHQHLDLGSFVFDALGERWAEDLGLDNYKLPDYFKAEERWKFYRVRAEGHNTLVLNPGGDADQRLGVTAKITKFRSLPAESFAIADLSSAYSQSATKVRRGIKLVDRRGLLIQDEMTFRRETSVWWFMHTKADIQIAADGASATLSKGNSRLIVRLLSPPGAKFSAVAAAPLEKSPHPQNQNLNPGYRKLAINLKASKKLRLAVSLSPVTDKKLPESPATNLRSLDNW